MYYSYIHHTQKSPKKFIKYAFVVLDLIHNLKVLFRSFLHSFYDISACYMFQFLVIRSIILYVSGLEKTTGKTKAETFLVMI